jgi:hypothetical protein
MTKSQSLRSSLTVEALEGRLVLSSGGLAQELATVAAAITTFEHTYATDVNTILFHTSWSLKGASTNTVANRPAFDAAIGAALNTLNSTIDGSLASLGTTVATPLEATIKNELLSAGSTDGSNLQSVLVGETTPSAGVKFAAQHFNIVSQLNIGTVQREVNAAITTALNP